MLPYPFQQQMKAQLGAGYTAFEAALQAASPVSIRLNPAKPVDSALLYPDSEPMPWHPLGRYLAERPVFTLDPAFHAGAYYVQEPSSMFLYEALRQTVDFSRPLVLLDLCAAPGGKSTLVASMLGPHDLLVSNEVIRSRVGVLRENMEKWGTPNTAVVSADAAVFAEQLPEFFDVVVVDAPCSGEGLFRKDPDATKEWSPEHVELCAGRQQRILEAAAETLQGGGVLVYSTCTYNQQENEANVRWAESALGLEPIPLAVPTDWGIVSTGGGYQFYPHLLRGEGFFIAVFRKKHEPTKRKPASGNFAQLKPAGKNLPAEVRNFLDTNYHLQHYLTPGGDLIALPAHLEQVYLSLDKALKFKMFGVQIGTVKGKDFIPSHGLALSSLISHSAPAVDMNLEQALLFLKKEPPQVAPDAPRGWALARYYGLNLGWMKILPNRVNNYLPPERRIRMDLTL